MYEDQPPFGADEKCRALHFGGHPLAHSVLGTAERISALSVDAMRAYFRQRYSARNVVLAASGRVDFDGWWRGRSDLRLVSRAAATANSHPPLPPRSFMSSAGTALQGVSRPTRPRSVGQRRRPLRQQLLATIVGDETGSRIFWN